MSSAGPITGAAELLSELWAPLVLILVFNLHVPHNFAVFEQQTVRVLFLNGVDPEKKYDERNISKGTTYSSRNRKRNKSDSRQKELNYFSFFVLKKKGFRYICHLNASSALACFFSLKYENINAMDSIRIMSDGTHQLDACGPKTTAIFRGRWLLQIQT